LNADNPDFTETELDMLAGFVVSRYDSLMEIQTDPKVTNMGFRRSAKKDAKKIEVLAEKLRPFHTGKYDN
jgi:hypothetical protein